MAFFFFFRFYDLAGTLTTHFPPWKVIQMIFIKRSLRKVTFEGPLSHYSWHVTAQLHTVSVLNASEFCDVTIFFIFKVVLIDASRSIVTGEFLTSSVSSGMWLLASMWVSCLTERHFTSRWFIELFVQAIYPKWISHQVSRTSFYDFRVAGTTLLLLGVWIWLYCWLAQQQAREVIEFKVFVLL